MEDFLDILSSRKSIRRYKPDPVPDEMLDKILEAARWAPTGENYQPWRFIVVRDHETRNRIGDLARIGSGSRMTAWYCMGHMQERFAGIADEAKRAEVLRFMYSGEVSEFAKQSPVVIAVIGSLREGSVDVPYDLSAAIENMLLEAHSLGLGGCWVHGPVASSRDARKFKEILGIPTGMGDYKVIAYVSIGWPAEMRKHPRPKKELDELVYWESSATRSGRAMDSQRYFNQLLYRMEEVFYHELSDCAPWKTELVGTDFIQTQDIKGASAHEVIEACIESIKAAGLAEDIGYSISGRDILLTLKIKGCGLMHKEVLLRKSGIKPYNCPITNMILDQLIEKLGYCRPMSRISMCPRARARSVPGQGGDLCHAGEDRRRVGLVETLAPRRGPPWVTPLTSTHSSASICRRASIGRNSCSSGPNCAIPSA